MQQLWYIRHFAVDIAPFLFLVNAHPYIRLQYETPIHHPFILVTGRQKKAMSFVFVVPPPTPLCTLHVSSSNVNSLFGYSLSARTWDLKPNPRLLWPFFLFAFAPSCFLLIKLLFGLRGGGPHCGRFHYFTVVLYRFFCHEAEKK